MRPRSEAVEVTQGLDILDLLHGQDVEVHGLDAGRERPALFGGHRLDEAAAEGAKPVVTLLGELEAHRDVALGLGDPVDAGPEVETREEVVEVEGPDGDLHGGSPPSSHGNTVTICGRGHSPPEFESVAGLPPSARRWVRYSYTGAPPRSMAGHPIVSSLAGNHSLGLAHELIGVPHRLG